MKKKTQVWLISQPGVNLSVNRVVERCFSSFLLSKCIRWALSYNTLCGFFFRVCLNGKSRNQWTFKVYLTFQWHKYLHVHYTPALLLSLNFWYTISELVNLAIVRGFICETQFPLLQRELTAGVLLLSTLWNKTLFLCWWILLLQWIR